MDSRSEKMGRAMVRSAVICASLIGALWAFDSSAHCRSPVVEKIAADVKADLAEWRRLIGNKESNGGR